MKYCPLCNNRLFPDSTAVCPTCHTVLLTATGRSPSRSPSRSTGSSAHASVPFLRRRFGKLVCHGQVVGVEHQELFYPKRFKIWNMFGRGEPYQFSYQVIETTIRVQSIGTTPTAETDFCLYGNYNRRISVGDEVIIVAKERRGMRVAQRVENVTTHSRLRPGLQVPGAWANRVLRLGIFFAALVLIGLVCSSTGSQMLQLVGVSMAGVGISVLILGACIWMIVQMFLPKR